MTKTSTEGRSPTGVLVHLELYKTLFFCGGAIILSLLVFALAKWNDLLFGGFGITFNGGPTAGLFMAIYLALSLKEVKANDISGAFFYGRALKPLAPGLHFLPFGLMQLASAPRTVQEFQCPGEPEKVFKGDDKDPLPEGMVRPIRVVTRAPAEDEKDMLDVRMTLDINFIIQYAIIDIFDYVANFGSTDEVERQLRDIGEATVSEQTTQKTPAGFITDLKKVNERLRTKTQDRFKNSGVHIISARLISPDITHKVSSAFAKIPIALAEAKEAEFRAEGERIKRTKEGEGAAAAKLLMLTAEAEGRKKIMDALGVDGNAVLASEAVNGILDKTDVLVMGQSGTTDAIGLVKAAQSALNSGKGGQS